MELLTKEEIQSSKFYFLSENTNFIKLHPRIPRRRMKYENETTKRICCVKRIYSALQALPLSTGMELCVYQIIPTNRTKFARPELTDVLDSSHTHELWCLNSVAVKKVGIIKILGRETLWKRVKSPWDSNRNVLFDTNKNVTYVWKEKY